MNTLVAIKLNSGLGTIKSNDLIEEAFSKFDYVVKKYSRFDPNSNLSKLNNQSGKTVHISKELFFLIKTALTLAKLSDGLFDPTIVDLLEIYGYTSKYFRHEVKDLTAEIKNILNNRPKWQDIELDEHKSTIKLKPTQRIDLGNIGKGYAIDLATKVLLPSENFLINAGGDIYAHGKNEKGRIWDVGLCLSSDTKKIFGKIKLKNSSLACSGSAAIKLKNFHHLLNPKTGRPMQGIDQSFVLHQSAMLADGYATMLFLTGKRGLDILEKQKIGGLILKGRKVITNKYFQKWY